MKKPNSLPLLIGLAVVLGVNYFAYTRWYAAPVSEKRAELAQVEERTRSFRNRTATMLQARRDIKPLIDRTLGPSAQSAEAALRERMNSLFRKVGLPGTTVESRVAQRATVNPASDARLSAFRAADSRGRMRAAPQSAFVTMNATLRGEGPSEKVLEALALLESQQWIQRVTSVSIDPVIRSEERSASFSFEVQTLYIPEQSPQDGPPLAEFDPQRQTLAAAIVGRSMFTPPPPPQPVVREDPKPEPKPVVERPPPPPPYDQWVVAFLRDGSAGPEITIRKPGSGQTRTLTIGDRFHGMTFTGFDRIDAIFEFDGRTYRIGVGQNLATRDKPEAVQ